MKAAVLPGSTIGGHVAAALDEVERGTRDRLGQRHALGLAVEHLILRSKENADRQAQGGVGRRHRRQGIAGSDHLGGGLLEIAWEEGEEPTAFQAEVPGHGIGGEHETDGRGAPDEG